MNLILAREKLLCFLPTWRINQIQSQADFDVELCVFFFLRSTLSECYSYETRLSNDFNVCHYTTTSAKLNPLSALRCFSYWTPIHSSRFDDTDCKIWASFARTCKCISFTTLIMLNIETLPEYRIRFFIFRIRPSAATTLYYDFVSRTISELFQFESFNIDIVTI